MDGMVISEQPGYKSTAGAVLIKKTEPNPKQGFSTCTPIFIGGSEQEQV